MKTCVLIMPFGKNVQNIQQDVRTWLNSQGYTVLNTHFVARETDKLDELSLVCYVDNQGDYKSGTDVFYENTPLVLVANGGTTPQQWYIFNLYASALTYQTEMSNSYNILGTFDGNPTLVLDAQKDGITVLGEVQWTT